jgi:hypothetical protein
LTGPVPPLAIPTTLHASLMARLDRLAPIREVAQIGAAIGREFSYELLAALVPLPESTLQGGSATDLVPWVPQPRRGVETPTIASFSLSRLGRYWVGRAPRPTKMGTIASQWRYDAVAHHALQLAILRRSAILRYA